MGPHGNGQSVHSTSTETGRDPANVYDVKIGESKRSEWIELTMKQWPFYHHRSRATQNTKKERDEETGTKFRTPFLYRLKRTQEKKQGLIIWCGAKLRITRRLNRCAWNVRRSRLKNGENSPRKRGVREAPQAVKKRKWEARTCQDHWRTRRSSRRTTTKRLCLRNTNNKRKDRLRNPHKTRLTRRPDILHEKSRARPKQTKKYKKRQEAKGQSSHID